MGRLTGGNRFPPLGNMMVGVNLEKVMRNAPDHFEYYQWLHWLLMEYPEATRTTIAALSIQESPDPWPMP